MQTGLQKVTQLIAQACAQYPGGMRAVFRNIQEIEGRRKSQSAFYADFNPNPTSGGSLKVGDLLHAMQITGDTSALRYMAALFGYSLASLSAAEPDAPTIEAEMLQDYPALVEFHKACAARIKGEVDMLTLDARKDAAITDIRQTFAMAEEKARKGQE